MVQAIILAAGKSTRTYPLTLTRPKPLLKVLNKPLLEYTLDGLIQAGVNEAIIVVGYKKEMIMDYFKDSYKGLKLRYHVQQEQNGTWPAVYGVRDLIEDKFVVCYADDLHSGNDIKRCLQYKSAVLAVQTKTPELYGILKVENGLIKEIIEKPKEFVGDLASTGILVFDKSVFRFGPEISPNRESYLTDMINKLCKEEEVYPVIVNDYWLPTGYPWHLLQANEYLIQNITSNISNGDLGPHVVVSGKVRIGKGAIVKAFTTIEGPVVIGENCRIGPNAYLRPGTVIGDNCHIGASVEIKNSIIMDNTNIPHQNYVGDSILGEHVNLGAGTKIANKLNAEGDKLVLSKYGNLLISTGRTKFGAVIGDNVQTGINTSIKPGRKIWPGMKLDANLIIQDDIMPEEKS